MATIRIIITVYVGFIRCQEDLYRIPIMVVWAGYSFKTYFNLLSLSE